jgi:hypothetical protein
MGDKTLANVQLYVCDISKSCSPALGILGLDLFPALGIEIHGVPVNYPRSPNHDDDFIEKEDPDFDVEWLEKYKAQPELREQLLAKIAPFIQANDDIPPDSFCTHPSAVVHLNTGDASPVYVPQYRVSDHMAKWIDIQVEKWTQDKVICDAPPDSKWNSPLLAALDRAAKAKGKDPRVCIDPRKINAILESDPRSIPDVKDMHSCQTTWFQIYY